MCPEEISDRTGQETSFDEENTDVIDADKNERLDQFGEEANQEEECQAEHENDSSLVEDEPHILWKKQMNKLRQQYLCTAGRSDCGPRRSVFGEPNDYTLYKQRLSRGRRHHKDGDM